MRFHTAATYLAQSLLPVAASGALAVSGDHKKRVRERQILFHQLISNKLNQVPLAEKKNPLLDLPLKKASSKRDPTEVAHSDVDVVIEDVKECDPRLNQEDNLDEALGLLFACEDDETCIETETSKTGGVCLKTTVAIKQARQRRLQDYGQALCDAYPTCNCDDYDSDTSTGSTVCTEVDYCYPDTAICGTSTVTSVHYGESYPDIVQYCFEVSEGDAGFGLACYEYNSQLYDCTITVDGDMCAACDVEECAPGSMIPSGPTFDCSDTVLGTSGNYCEGDTIFPFLNEPTVPPTEAPSMAPSAAATEAPSMAPSAAATEAPTMMAAATIAPSMAPVVADSEAPTATPVAASEAPTSTPVATSEAPTSTPVATSEAPTATPVATSEAPTATPVATSEAPSASPVAPTQAPVTPVPTSGSAVQMTPSIVVSSALALAVLVGMFVN